MSTTQFDLWIESMQRMAVVESQIRELESEKYYLRDIIKILDPENQKLDNTNE